MRKFYLWRNQKTCVGIVYTAAELDKTKYPLGDFKYLGWHRNREAAYEYAGEHYPYLEMKNPCIRP